MAYKINPKICLKCGLCVNRCPENAIVGKPFQQDELSLTSVAIDPRKCTDCGVCVSEEFWCPAKAISRA
ncbi:MAG: 4Fe-4S binding protein [Dehalococcoidales bacterium]